MIWCGIRRIAVAVVVVVEWVGEDDVGGDRPMVAARGTNRGGREGGREGGNDRNDSLVKD